MIRRGHIYRVDPKRHAGDAKESRLVLVLSPDSRNGSFDTVLAVPISIRSRERMDLVLSSVLAALALG